MLSDTTFAVAMEALTEYEHARRAFYDAEPKAIADADTAKAARGELQAAQAAGEWRKINKVDCVCGKSTCAKCVRIEYSDGISLDTLWYTREDGCEEMMYLPNDIRLYRRIDSQEGRNE